MCICPLCTVQLSLFHWFNFYLAHMRSGKVIGCVVVMDTKITKSVRAIDLLNSAKRTGFSALRIEWDSL